MQFVFTAQFNKPFQGVLADFNTAGSLTSTYSATATAAAVPEPLASILIGIGLLSLAFVRRRPVS